MDRWIELANLADLPPGGRLEVVRDGRTYALFRPEDRVFGTLGLCPHQGGRLARGEVAGTVVTCPRRGCLRWRFDFETGAGSAGAGARLGLLAVRVEGGAILAHLPAP